MNADENNLVDFLNQLKEDGYTKNYIVEDGKLKSEDTGEYLDESDFNITLACKFDITENAVDSQYLFGVDSEKGNGYIVDILGNYYFDNSELLERKIDFEIEEHIIEDEEELKYGLPKIYNTLFDSNPDRFELRVNYPDFPVCPFDTGFTMLGYDKEKKEYVWLVTSIINDPRLQRVNYNG